MLPKIVLKAWIVPVWTSGEGGEAPMPFCYIAGYSERDDAVEAVRLKSGVASELIGAPSPVSNLTAEALGVKPGTVMFL
jgi:hypothetical protein